MTNFTIIFITFLMGFLFKKSKRFPTTTPIAINQFILLISLPAMILSKVPTLLRNLSLDGNWWVAVSMPWILFFVSWIVIRYIGRKKQWSSAKTGALILTCGLGNTSFVGFPLLEATLGTESIPYGVLVDQLGSFLILATMGLVVAGLYSGENVKPENMIRRLFTFPPFISLIISVVWFFVRLPAEDHFHVVFEKISMTLVPLALFSVGFQTDFKFSVIRRRIEPLGFGLFFKLILMPIVFYIFYFKLLSQNDLLTKTTLLESAMATQITAAVVAAESNLDTELANLMVSLSIPISLLTVPLIYLILKF